MTPSALSKKPSNLTIARASFAALLAMLGTLFLASFGVVTPAQAHDDITNTAPAEGSTVEAGQFEVSITSSGELMNLEEQTTNDITVVGPLNQASSGVVSAPCIRVVGKVASVPVEIVEPGEYRATWQVVGSDGHAISGNFSFNVTNDTGYTAKGFASLPADCKPIPMATTAEGVTPGAETPKDEHSGNHSDAPAANDGQWIGLLVGIGFVVLASVAGALTVKIREAYRAKKPRKLDQD